MHPKAAGIALADTLRLRYQPIFRLRDGAVCHAEVLARSQTADGQLLGPQAIVDVMSCPEAALHLTLAIMDLALCEYVEHGLHRQGLELAFNLPLNVLVFPGLIERIRAVQAQYGLDSTVLRFELTETQPVRDPPAALASIAGLRAHGYLLALDDAVPGMACLDALLGAPLSAIKLDRSVVTDEGADATMFIRAMTGSAKRHGQEVVAEGIETASQMRRMQALGVSHGQGYFFACPLTALSLTEMLSAAKG